MRNLTPTFGSDVFQIVDVLQPGQDAIAITSYKIAKETDDGQLQEALHGRYDVQEYVPPAPYIDSEDDEYPDRYSRTAFYIFACTFRRNFALLRWFEILTPFACLQMPPTQRNAKTKTQALKKSRKRAHRASREGKSDQREQMESELLDFETTTSRQDTKRHPDLTPLENERRHN